MTLGLNIVGDGRQTLGTTREQALELGYTEEEISLAEVAAASSEQKAVVRARIKVAAGDTLSILGTTSDASTVSLIVASCLISSLVGASDFKAFKDAAITSISGALGGDNPGDVFAKFLADVDSDVSRLPALEKGFETVLHDVIDRGTSVSNAISPAG